MALETGTYISDLDSANPTATDDVSEGDDHIRLLKSTIKATFPNISGAMNATHTELNNVADGAVIAGTWTATLTLGAGTASLYSTANTLFYTKIGKQVFVTGRLTIQTVSTPSGSITINGLPFTAATSTAQETVSYFPAYVNGTTGTPQAPGNWWEGRVDSAGTVIDIFDEGTSGGDHLQANSNIYLNFHYPAAS